MITLGDVGKRARPAAWSLIGFAAFLLVSQAPVEAQTCIGDCNEDGTVKVNELLVGVNIALDLLPLSSCPSLGRPEPTATIARLIIAVNNASEGCPVPVPTATATEPPTVEPTETPTHDTVDTATATVPPVST